MTSLDVTSHRPRGLRAPLRALVASCCAAALCGTALAAQPPGQAPGQGQMPAQVQMPGQVQLQAPLPGRPPAVHAVPLSGNQPVTFLADRVTYDKVNGIVTADGHVQAWQNDHYLAADRVTFDRMTDVAAAHGHVVIVEPDGQVVFGDYAEVSQGMKNGIISGMRSLLADGGKLAANGARRTDGKLNELSRAVYSSCNVCALDPDAPPEWQFRSDHMTQDLEHKRIEYSDSWFDVYGVPIFYLPYMSSSDPSVKRQSGFLVPSFGASSEHLGAFASVPYFWVLDDQSDLTLTPEVNSQQGGQLQADYRRWFNDGRVDLQGGIAHDDNALAGYFFGNASFIWNDTWRYGASVNIGNSATYLRDYQITPWAFNYLETSGYIEGFGVGSYAKLDAAGYQGLNASIKQSTLPYVLPRYSYDFFGEPDFWGGRFSFDTMEFNIVREEGTNTRRIAARAAWDRIFNGLLGERYQLTAEVTGAGYQASRINAQPNYGDAEDASTGHAEPQVALKMNWPFVRDAGSLGTQVIEPIVQLIAGPQTGNSLHDRLPNEDSLDYEFTDSTLFSRNRFGGYDRFDGGPRANFGLHGAWTFKGGQSLDALVGASLIEHIDRNLYPQFQPWNGFENGKHLSDIVSRVSFSPSSWLNVTARTRVDHDNGDIRFADAITGFGHPWLHFNFGYLYSSTNPYELYLNAFGNKVDGVSYFALGDFTQPDFLSPGNKALNFFTPRNEVSAGVASKLGHWSVSVNTRRNLENAQFDDVNFHAHWEDECTGFDMLAGRRYTSILGDRGNTTLLFTITLKTVGQFGFK